MKIRLKGDYVKKFFIVVSLIASAFILLFMSCEDRLKMDPDKCAEVTLKYMEEKYQTEFEVLSSGEVGRVIGWAGYAEVEVSNKYENTDNRYTIIVYPDGSSDKDKDGYYDSYKVVSDTYMCEVLRDYVKSEVDKLLMDAGLTRFINNVGIMEGGGIAGFLGFAADFPVLSEDNFSLKNVLDNYRITINCWIKIPESEYSEELQNSITNIMRPLITDDLIAISLDVYDEETYNGIEELRKNNIGYNKVGNPSIYFSVEEEDTDESK